VLSGWAGKRYPLLPNRSHFSYPHPSVSSGRGLCFFVAPIHTRCAEVGRCSLVTVPLFSIMQLPSMQGLAPERHLVTVGNSRREGASSSLGGFDARTGLSGHSARRESSRGSCGTISAGLPACWPPGRSVLNKIADGGGCGDAGGTRNRSDNTVANLSCSCPHRIRR
jgi:hypothetical protein